jgi:hypothetical protein
MGIGVVVVRVSSSGKNTFSTRTWTLAILLPQRIL